MRNLSIFILMLCGPLSSNLKALDSFAQADSFVIHFLGHASLMIEYDDKIIHIDPTSAQANYDLLPKADIIFITHGHGDHYELVTLNKIKKETTEMVCTQAVSNLGTYSGKKTVMNNGDSIFINGIVVNAVPAYNIANGTFHPKGTGNGYIITLGEKRIYIAGDTENIPEMENLGEIDIAFIPMNLPYTMTPEMAADAAKKIKPEVLYIYHFGSSDTGKLRNLLSDQNMEIRIGKSVFTESTVRGVKTAAVFPKNQLPVAAFYPNPVKDLLTVEISEPGSLLSIYDLRGQSVAKFDLSGIGAHQLNAGDLKTGVYVLEFDQFNIEGNQLLLKE